MKYFNIILIFVPILCFATYQTSARKIVAPEVGCSVYIEEIGLAIAKQYEPSVPSQKLSACTYNPIYLGDNCCNYNESLLVNDTMIYYEMVFGENLSCMHYIWDMSCAFSCSPNQVQYLVPVNVDSQNDQILSIKFNINPTYAQSLYGACKTVKAPNGKSFGQLYPTYQQFFQGVFGDSNNPNFNDVIYNYDSTIGYNGN
ncbi:putative transmembrane protein [Heterostelium album PN500]|uniref:Putative transmembrane protein n=1 Tax=Heterostelium pallidum (strain ATCC 26659 / Pp 5 / PN500) TaxID=670386 RepID=D3AXA4_HETP5|nr:putative transmembrane protein [Heterostelium album PN500]EFA86173.1 putative transmembrane protein [Heterostelium album PN500]|eukprot:XP_020438278.1 putative transmembrane protein [Heterostelium album PN500]